MTSPAKTIHAFGLYLLTLSPLLIFLPNIVLGMVGIEPTSEIWIRVVGMLLGNLGTLCIVAAKYEFRPFFVWSVPLRASVFFFFLAFVLLHMAPWPLLLFGVIDLACVTWTFIALRKTAVTAIHTA